MTPSKILNSVSKEMSDLKNNVQENYFIPIKNEYACLGTFLFVLALFGAVINIPCFLTLPADSIFLRIIWRHFVLVVLLIPKLFYDSAALGSNINQTFSSTNMFNVFAISLINTIWLYLFYFAASHTFAAHTLLLQLPMLFLTFWKLIKKDVTTYLELIGVATCVFGAYWITNEGATLDRRDIIIGNLAAFSSSIFGAIYVAVSSKIQDKSMPVSIYLVLMGGWVIILSLVFSAFAGENLVIISTDPRFGLFGLFSSVENIIYGFLGMGLMAGFSLYYFSIKSSEFISPMFVNTTFNTAPFLSQVTCYVLGVQGFPGSYTAYGGFWLFIGCTILSMTYQDHKDLITKYPLYSKQNKYSGLEMKDINPKVL